MNELVSLIVKKTGLPEAMAMTVVNIVIDYLKKKLPAPVGAALTSFLSNDAEVQMAENLIGGLVTDVEKSVAKKGKK
ncbi:MAG TPA: hypothetical protein VMC09_14335 [Anaerolineales bacterium]|nr:hypothetical protein [Anaerolineales bacterium]